MRLAASRLLRMAAAGLVMTASPALACPGCITSGDDRIPAYLGTALLLSVLPLGLAAGIGLWLRRRLRAHGSPAAEPAHGGVRPAGPVALEAPPASTPPPLDTPHPTQ